jgi:uncharacterized protein (TIGR02117 family)
LLRALRLVGLMLAAALTALAMATVLTARPGDPSLFPAGEDAVDAYLVGNGYHSGLILPTSVVRGFASEGRLGAVLAVAVRFSAYDWIEVGWGERRFYAEVPTIDRLNWRLALSALFRPGNGSVLHIVGVQGAPRVTFPSADLVHLRLSREGLRRLLMLLDETFERPADGLPVEIGPGLYGPSLFYEARGSFHVLNVCNHWTARLLDAAGVPTTPVLSALPVGLLLDLQWRSGLTPVSSTTEAAF